MDYSRLPGLGSCRLTSRRLNPNVALPRFGPTGQASTAAILTSVDVGLDTSLTLAFEAGWRCQASDNQFSELNS
eukprot:920746-Amphidinium_carterae.1